MRRRWTRVGGGALALLSFGFASAAPAAPRVIGRMPIAAEGYAVASNSLFCWGEGAYRLKIDAQAPVVDDAPEKLADGSYMEGGAAFDADGDGVTDLALVEKAAGGKTALVWLQAPHWNRHVIDTGVQSRDMLPVTLFGKRGLLVIHRGNQVRFYEIPARPEDPWPETDLYSFYTPSEEGGLAIADVNGDGRPDILAGNYFIESPVSRELPWHLWAIDTWTETQPSALLRVGWTSLAPGAPPVRVAMQRATSPARFDWFEKPVDFRDLWKAHPIGAQDALDHPCAWAAVKLGASGRPALVVAEQGGAGRLLLYADVTTGVPGVVLLAGRPWRGASLLNEKGVPPSLIAFDDKDLLAWEPASSK